MNGRLAIFGGEPVRRRPFPSISDASGRDVGDDELRLLAEVIKSGRLFRYDGAKVKQFEEEFTKYFGVKYAIASTSGTAAIHIALGALRLNPGSEVITSPITDMGTAIPIIAQNMIPIFADVDLETYNIEPGDVERRITEKTKAIIPVHLFGQPCDLDPIIEIAEKKGLYVVEDCAQAQLAEYRGRLAGSIGDLGCFSFQQSKHMTTGDGGVTVTNDDELAYRARLFMDKGWDRFVKGPYPRTYPSFGFNYRMTELQGAVALAQLRKLRGVVERRRNVASLLTKLIDGVRGVYPPKILDGVKHSFWLYPVRMDREVLKISAEEFAKALNAEGVPAGAGYIGRPIYMAPIFLEKKVYGESSCPFNCPLYGGKVEYREGLCPNAEKVLKETVTLPCNEFFTEEDVKDIANAIEKVSSYYLKH